MNRKIATAIEQGHLAHAVTLTARSERIRERAVMVSSGALWTVGIVVWTHLITQILP